MLQEEIHNILAGIKNLSVMRIKLLICYLREKKQNNYLYITPKLCNHCILINNSTILQYKKRNNSTILIFS